MTALMDTASWARRMGALIVDWLASTLVVVLVVGVDDYYDGNAYGSLVVLAVFVVQSTIFTTTVGGSFGQIATRLRVVRADGDPRPPDPLRALARQVLIALVIPPLVFRPDGRGLHDIAAGTATVTIQQFKALRGT